MLDPIFFPLLPADSYWCSGALSYCYCPTATVLLLCIGQKLPIDMFTPMDGSLCERFLIHRASYTSHMGIWHALSTRLAGSQRVATRSPRPQEVYTLHGSRPRRDSETSTCGLECCDPCFPAQAASAQCVQLPCLPAGYLIATIHVQYEREPAPATRQPRILCACTILHC